MTVEPLSQKIIMQNRMHDNIVVNSVLPTFSCVLFHAYINIIPEEKEIQPHFRENIGIHFNDVIKLLLFYKILHSIVFIL